MTSAIELRSVSRVFGALTALDDVSITVPEGSICGLLGRNGAGKTTIMSIIAGQDRPTSGSVEVFGQRPFENEAALRGISFVRDNQRYPDNYRLKHVLRIAPAFLPNWSEELAGELADGLRIPEGVHIRKFSRGQLSSVAIVLALASRAPVTLLDEPYLGLDVTARALFHDVLLRDFAAHPRTVLLSTHLIEESEALLDRVIIVDRGRVWFEGDTDEAARVAFTLSGPADAVGRLAEGRPVLRRHTVGPLAALTVRGTADDELRDEARRLGAQLTGTTLHDLVAAVGGGEPELLNTVKGTDR
jgi:ABC-2 type transport system ATP-binding protein